MRTTWTVESPKSRILVAECCGCRAASSQLITTTHHRRMCSQCCLNAMQLRLRRSILLKLYSAWNTIFKKGGQTRWLFRDDFAQYHQLHWKNDKVVFFLSARYNVLHSILNIKMKRTKYLINNLLLKQIITPKWYI